NTWQTATTRTTWRVIRFAGGHTVAQFVRQNIREVGSRNASGEQTSLIEKISRTIDDRRNGNGSCVDSLYGPGSLIIYEEKRFAFNDGPAHGPAELILLKNPAFRRKEILCVENCVAQELERAPVNLVRAGLGHNIDDAAAVVAILGVEIVGKNPKLRYGIEIRHNG